MGLSMRVRESFVSLFLLLSFHFAEIENLHRRKWKEEEEELFGEESSREMGEKEITEREEKIEI